MASKKNNPKADPADLTLRCFVVEWRTKGSDEGWRQWLTAYRYGAEPREEGVIYECNWLSERMTDREFRYRAAPLTFDDDGRRCVIY